MRVSVGEVPPLTKRYPDGRVYTRMETVETQLSQLIDLPFDEVLDRARIASRSHPGYLRSETLVHLMRATRRDNRETRFGRLFELFLKRVAGALPRAERVNGDKTIVDSALSEINDAALARIQILVTLDRQGGDHLDFYEVHFDEAVAMLRLSARRKVAKRVHREVEIETDAETGELPGFIERAAGSLDETVDPILLDPIFRPHLLRAIDSLPPEQKEVITMTMLNMPSESKDPAIPSISSILECDPRTVRNRRDRAVITLREILDQGEAG